jgi:carbonic anhydrase
LEANDALVRGVFMKNSTRTALLTIIALALALGLLAVPGRQWTANSRTLNPPAQVTEPRSDTESVDAATALKWLEEGNVRWQRWQTMKTRNWGEQRAANSPPKEQHPFAVVISCMDSRVPPELVFDQGLGDIFVIRVAGPVLDVDELASLEYAVVKKKVKLVLVLGHTNCGAVEGAVAKVSGTYLPALLEKLEPAITYVSNRYNGGNRITLSDPITPAEQTNLNRVSIANARHVHYQVLEKLLFREPGVQVKWGLYYLPTGRVAFDPTEIER